MGLGAFFEEVFVIDVEVVFVIDVEAGLVAGFDWTISACFLAGKRPRGIKLRGSRLLHSTLPMAAYWAIVTTLLVTKYNERPEAKVRARYPINKGM